MKNDEPDGKQKANIRVMRKSDRDIKMRGLEVLLDGEHLTDIAFGTEGLYEIEAGQHTLVVTNTVSSRKEDFTVSPGGTVVFEALNVVTGLGAVMISALGIGPYKVELRRIA